MCVTACCVVVILLSCCEKITTNLDCYFANKSKILKHRVVTKKYPFVCFRQAQEAQLRRKHPYSSGRFGSLDCLVYICVKLKYLYYV